MLQAPVMTTLLGKSAFPEVHPLALGSGSGVMSGIVRHFVSRADVVFGIGSSFTKHGMCMNIPSGKTLIQATNDPRTSTRTTSSIIPWLATPSWSCGR